MKEMRGKQQSSIRKRKITPISLLSQMKKNNILGKDRRSALTFFEQQHRKMSSRYENESAVKNVKTESNCDDQMQCDKKMSKVEQLVSRTPMRSRFQSMQRIRQKKSPYLSEQRKRMSLEKEESSYKNLGAVVRASVEKKKKSKFNINNKEGQQNRQISNFTFNRHRIFKHFQNIWKIHKMLRDKRHQFQILRAIEAYVLDDEGDSSDLDMLYICKQTATVVKKILFLEKIIVIMVVDLIINSKFKLTSTALRSGMAVIIQFYAAVYIDLNSSEKIDNSQLLILSGEAIKYLLQASHSASHDSFSLMSQCLEAKVKSCFKFSQAIEHFHQHFLEHVAELSSNLSYFRLLQYFSLCLLGINWSPWKIQFLETCPSPYIHSQPQKKYVLVLDLDETLIHYKIKSNYHGQFLIRPYLFEFLQKMSHHYEIGIFTCSLPEYADIIINRMEHISFRLYRHHTIRVNNEYIKDLSRIGRNLQHLIMVDNIEKNYRLQSRNGILVRSWYGDKKDCILNMLASELIKLADLKPEDIRETQFKRQFL